MAYVTFDSNNNITGVFANPQPHLDGFQEIDGGDSRIAAFQDKRSALAQAHDLLSQTDAAMHRISEAVALGLSSFTNADVVAFVNYRRALRGIISTGTGTIPQKPSYPAGS